MPYATAGDIRIYHEIGGAGPRLLFIGGTNGDLRRPNSVFNSPLPDSFEVLGFDQRGLGRTDKPDTPYSMAQYGDDAAALLDAVGWDACHVVGVSFGGMVAQEVALRHSGRVNGLVLCCTAAGGAGGSSFPLHTLGGLSDEEKVRHAIPRNDARRDDEWQRRNPKEYQAVFDEGLAVQQFAADEDGHLTGQRRQLEARADHDTFDRLGQVAAPTIVCGGRHDGQAEPRTVENLARAIPGARLEFFEGGHLFLQQDATAYGVVTDFLLGLDL